MTYYCSKEYLRIQFSLPEMFKVEKDEGYYKFFCKRKTKANALETLEYVY